MWRGVHPMRVETVAKYQKSLLLGKWSSQQLPVLPIGLQWNRDGMKVIDSFWGGLMIIKTRTGKG